MEFQFKTKNVKVT